MQISDWIYSLRFDAFSKLRKSSWGLSYFFFPDDAVNLTSEKHDPNAQMNHLQKEENKKKKTKRPYRRHRCGAGQIPSESQVRNILTTLEY